MTFLLLFSFWNCCHQNQGSYQVDWNWASGNCLGWFSCTGSSSCSSSRNCKGCGICKWSPFCFWKNDPLLSNFAFCHPEVLATQQQSSPESEKSTGKLVVNLGLWEIKYGRLVLPSFPANPNYWLFHSLTHNGAAKMSQIISKYSCGDCYKIVKNDGHLSCS